jgi:hypothetical protein
MTRRHVAMVGSDVGDQTQLRPAFPPRSIDEFVSFLTQLEDMFGPVERAHVPTTGERFEL